MLISIVNRTRSVSDAEVRQAVRAINRQLAEDFEPHWHFGARLRQDAASQPAEVADRKAFQRRLPDRHGEAVIYLLDKATIAGAEGFHDRNAGDVPCGFVFLDVCRAVNDPWTVALSHEVLEMVGDPLNNLLVQGPDPRDRRRMVFHMFEMCDAVQSETYEIDGVAVSNFVLPSYFTRGDQPGDRNDFLGRRADQPRLRSFEMAPGGYLCFYDPLHPADDKWLSQTRPDDAVAAGRIAAKRGYALGRIARRHGAGQEPKGDPQ